MPAGARARHPLHQQHDRGDASDDLPRAPRATTSARCSSCGSGVLAAAKHPSAANRSRWMRRTPVVPSRVVTSTIAGVAAAGSMRHVLLLGPDDDARRALHLMLDRLGKQVSAVGEIDAARAYLGNGHDCDAVVAAGELAAQ